MNSNWRCTCFEGPSFSVFFVESLENAQQSSFPSRQIAHLRIILRQHKCNKTHLERNMYIVICCQMVAIVYRVFVITKTVGVVLEFFSVMCLYPFVSSQSVEFHIVLVLLEG